MKLFLSLIFPVSLFLVACIDRQQSAATNNHRNAERSDIKKTGTVITFNASDSEIITGSTQPSEVIDFAEKMIGIPYKYGSVDPDQGFDCSGFITYVFNHFKISVPRSSRDFTDIKQPIELRNSLPGDLILFTGTDSTKREVGHMGIITENNGTDISFIHSTSGKAYGVTVTPLNKYYQGRFVKAIRIFKNYN